MNKTVIIKVGRKLVIKKSWNKTDRKMKAESKI